MCCDSGVPISVRCRVKRLDLSILIVSGNGALYAVA